MSVSARRSLLPDRSSPSLLYRFPVNLRASLALGFGLFRHTASKLHAVAPTELRRNIFSFSFVGIRSLLATPGPLVAFLALPFPGKPSGFPHARLWAISTHCVETSRRRPGPLVAFLALPLPGKPSGFPHARLWAISTHRVETSRRRPGPLVAFLALPLPGKPSGFPHARLWAISTHCVETLRRHPD